MTLYLALLVVSAIGCVGLALSPRHGLRETISSTIVVAPLFAIVVVYLIRHVV